MNTEMLRNVIERKIDVDLSSLLPKVGELLEGEKTELKLIEYYRFLQNQYNSPLTLFNKYMLSHYYKDDKKHSPSEIYFFIKDKIYINKVMFFLDSIYREIVNLVNPEFVDIVFDSFVDNTDTKLIAKFTVYYPERLSKWV